MANHRDTVVIRVEILKEGKQYVALCPDLNVSSFGETPEDAKESLKEAVSLFMEECARMGTLQQVLEESGFSFTKRPTHHWLPPVPVGMEQLALPIAHAA